MPNVMSVQYRGLAMSQFLRRLEVRQEVNKHTLTVMDYNFVDRARYTLPEEFTPMTIRWGKSPTGVRTTYGYFNHYETLNDSSKPGSVYTQVVGLGTSQPFNTSEARAWSGYTRSGIARELAKKHNLRSIIHAHPEVLTTWGNGLDTDFIALGRLADECGYYSWIDGSTLFFLDPKRTLSSAVTQDVPRFTFEQVWEASVVGGTNAPREQGSVRRRVIHGLDTTTNEFFTATSGSTMYPTETLSAPVATFTEAQQVTSSKGQRDDDYYTLTATLEGDANVYPGAIINIAGNRVTDDQRGYWFVRKATHVMVPDQFRTRVVASRGVNKVPVLNASSTLLNTRIQVPAILRDDLHWEAQIQEHVNV